MIFPLQHIEQMSVVQGVQITEYVEMACGLLAFSAVIMAERQ